jgi:hypothetical protein
VSAKVNRRNDDEAGTAREAPKPGAQSPRDPLRTEGGKKGPPGSGGGGKGASSVTTDLEPRGLVRAPSRLSGKEKEDADTHFPSLRHALIDAPGGRHTRRTRAVPERTDPSSGEDSWPCLSAESEDGLLGSFPLNRALL